MDSTVTKKFWTRTKIIIAAVLCLLLALGAFLFSQKVNPNAFHNRPNVENLNKLSEAELAEAQEEVESAFMLVPESSVIVSHVNLKALTPEAQNQWWNEWFFKMLPPEMTGIASLEGMEGLNSVTISAYRPVQEFDAENPEAWLDFPLLYTVIFNVDSEFANKTRDLIAERNANPDSIITLPPTMGGFLDENGVALEGATRTQSIAITQTLGFDFIQELNNGTGDSLEPNLEWFGVDAEPTLYLNVSQYLDSFSFTSDETLGDVNSKIRQAMLGIDTKTDFIWIGESFDFGTTWEKKANVKENQTNSNNPSLINTELFTEALSSTITPGLVNVNGELFVPDGSDPEQDVLVEAGIADMGLTNLLESISLKLPDQEVVGIAKDPYSIKPGTTAGVSNADEPNETPRFTEDDTVVVISPIYLLNVYKGSVKPSFIRTMTFVFSPDDSSKLIFDFKTEEQMQQDSEEAEKALQYAEDNKGELPPVTDAVETIVGTMNGEETSTTVVEEDE